MAVGLALVEQARHRLLADVAALGEADGPVVEPGLLGDRRVVDVDAEARAPGLDAHELGGLLGDLDGPGRHQRRLHRRGVGGRADHVDAVGRGDEHDLHAAAQRAHRAVLGRRQLLGAGDLAGARPDQRQQRALQRALVQLDVEADLEAADHVEQRLQRAALGVEPQLVAEVQHAHVALHLALVGQERGVQAGAGLQQRDVVGDLAVEELLGLRPGERELAALGPVHQPA